MSSVSEVYGSDYLQRCGMERIDYLISAIANNVAHREFSLHFDYGTLIWSENHILPNFIRQICQRITNLNPKLEVKHLNLSRLEDRRSIPFYIENTPVEYFSITDKQFNRRYLFYLTPAVMGVY